jgi:bisphosphoglycerate-independent phosphoglycerate mutase (AlkP superfamily)
MISPHPFPPLDRDKVMDFFGNRRQIISSKNGVTVRYDDLPDYLRGQEDILLELIEKIEAGAFDVVVTREEVPDLIVHFDEEKIRGEAEELLRSMGFSPVGAHR